MQHLSSLDTNVYLRPPYMRDHNRGHSHRLPQCYRTDVQLKSMDGMSILFHRACISWTLQYRRSSL